MTASEKKAREIVADCGAGSTCTCDEVYSGRSRSDPECRWCNFGQYLVVDIARALEQARVDALDEAAEVADEMVERSLELKAKSITDAALESYNGSAIAGDYVAKAIRALKKSEGAGK